MSKIWQWIKNLFGGGGGSSSSTLKFPERGITCLFTPRGTGNHTTWDPLEQPYMWDWLKSLGCNCVIMLAISTDARRLLTDDEFKAVYEKCKKNGLFPFWTMYVDGAVGGLDPKKWRANFARDTKALVAALDRLKIAGGIVFGIEHNEVLSAGEITAWANETRKITTRKICSHMQVGIGQGIPTGLDVVFVETNQPNKGDALSVSDFKRKAQDAITAVHRTGAKCMVLEYNEHVDGQRYKDQRKANSELHQWGYAANLGHDATEGVA